MTKNFCDLCGEPATGKEIVGISMPFPKEVLSDKKARVQIRFSLGFQNHSTGFGGPPDVCESCLIDLVNALKKKVEGRK